MNETSAGPYRSCAALLDISNPSKYLVEFSLVWWFSFVLFVFGMVGFGLVWFSWLDIARASKVRSVSNKLGLLQYYYYTCSVEYSVSSYSTYTVHTV